MMPDDDDVRFYNEHGWWVSPALIAGDELDDLVFGMQRYLAGERDRRLLAAVGTDWNPKEGGVLGQLDYISLQVEEFSRFIRHPFIGAAAGRLSGSSSMRLFHDQLIYKSPDNSGRTTVGWHTDIAYWQTCSSSNLITAWIPLQDCTPEMGPMIVIDRSHLHDGHEDLKSFHESDLDAISRRLGLDLNEASQVPMTLKRGQVSFHHCKVIHGSLPNRSDRPRAALAIHMQTEDNHYVINRHGGPKRQSHANDLLCRRRIDGLPDYADPSICPVLWHRNEGG